MDLVGVLLIVLVIALLFGYFKWSRKEATTMKTKSGRQKITVVVSGAYSPNVIKAQKGQPLTIVFDRKEDTACSKKVLFPDFEISAELKDFGKTEVTFTPDKIGEFVFSCEMGMYQGKLVVEK